jgi:restriction system protein
VTAVWVVRMTEVSTTASPIREKSAIAIGWYQLGDVSSATTREQLLQMVKQEFPTDKPMQQAMAAGQVYRFLNEMRPGDYVLTPIKATRTVLIGKVEGGYEFNPNLFQHEHPRVRKVSWLDEKPRDDFSVAARNTLGGLATIFRADAHLAEIEGLLGGAPSTAEAGEPQPPFYDDVKAKADELIGDVLAKLSGYEFQNVVAAVLRAMDYVAKVGPRGKDVGVDIIAHPDPLGFSEPRIKVQVKHRKGQATRPELQALSGALHQGEYGLFVSTGGFTKDAESWAGQSGKPITLKDGEAFVEMLLENYERLEPSVKALVPLGAVWIPIIE